MNRAHARAVRLLTESGIRLECVVKVLPATRFDPEEILFLGPLRRPETAYVWSEDFITLASGW